MLIPMIECEGQRTSFAARAEQLLGSTINSANGGCHNPSQSYDHDNMVGVIPHACCRDSPSRD